MVRGFYRALVTLLIEAGFRLKRQGRGDHEIWSHPDGRVTTVDRQTLSRHTANETLKQAGLPKAF